MLADREREAACHRKNVGMFVFVEARVTIKL